MRHAAWIVLVLAQVARAEPRIVIVETRGTPSLPALVSQVATQTGPRASVQIVAARDADPMTFGTRASSLVASGEATVVVWMAPVDRGFLVFAAGGWPGRALIELIQVDADLGAAELERTVALKIAGLLDAVLAPRVSAGAILGIRDSTRPAWRIEIDALVAREPHQRGLDGRVAVAASRAWSYGAWSVAPVLAGYWQPTGTIEGLRGRASITELGAALALEATRERAPLQLFARPRLTAAVLDARGTSGDGRRGHARLVAPHAGVEAGIRYAVSDRLWLGVVIGGDVALIHHELLVDDETIVDVGQIRAHVGAGFTMSL